MTPRTAANLHAVRDLLKSGRANGALAALDAVLLEHELKSMLHPMMQETPEPTPPVKPFWMRRGTK